MKRYLMTVNVVVYVNANDKAEARKLVTDLMDKVEFPTRATVINCEEQKMRIRPPLEG